MTAIVGVEGNGQVLIGGDSAGVAGLQMCTMTEPKVFTKGEFAFGYTSSFRMGQLIQYELEAPPHPESLTNIEYLVTKFIPAIRTCFKDHGFQRTKDGEESGGTFLVGYRGELFKVQGDYQVSRRSDGYDACGCGEAFSLGSLHATQGQQIERKSRVELALRAAHQFSAGVRPPFYFATSGGKVDYCEKVEANENPCPSPRDISKETMKTYALKIDGRIFETAEIESVTLKSGETLKARPSALMVELACIPSASPAPGLRNIEGFNYAFIPSLIQECAENFHSIEFCIEEIANNKDPNVPLQSVSASLRRRLKKLEQIVSYCLGLDVEDFAAKSRYHPSHRKAENTNPIESDEC